MIAFLGGLASAVLWAVSGLSASRSSRLIGPASVLGWVALIGLTIVAPAALLGPHPTFEPGVLLLGATSGLCTVFGFYLSYTALRMSQVGLIAPITSTGGAITATLAVTFGETLKPAAAGALVAIVVGVVLAATGRSRPDVPVVQAPTAQVALWRRSAPLLAIAAAMAFGLGNFATGHLSSSVPLAWAVLPARLAGVVLVTLPLASRGRLQMTRRALPIVVLGGLCEIGGLVAFALGARDGLAISAVLASQFAALAAVAAFFLFHERLARIQLAGVVFIAAGVAALAAARV